MCSHDPFFGTNKESSIWCQNDHGKFVGAFHFSRRVSDENGACSISICFFKIKDPFDGRSFLMCSHHPFFRTNKNRILKVIGIRLLTPVQNSVSLKLMQRKTLNFVINLPDVENLTK